MTRRKLYDHPERTPLISGKPPSLTPEQARFVAAMAELRKLITVRALAKMLRVSEHTITNYSTDKLPKRYRGPR